MYLLLIHPNKGESLMKENFTTLVCTRSKKNGAVSEYCAVNISINDFGALEIMRTFTDEYDYSKATFWAGMPGLKGVRISWLYKSLDIIEEMMSKSDVVFVGHKRRDFDGLGEIVKEFIPQKSKLYRRYRSNTWNVREIGDSVSLGRETIRAKVEANRIDFSLVKDIACAICDYESWDLLSDSVIKCVSYICIRMSRRGYDLEDFYQAIEEIVDAENNEISICMLLTSIAKGGVKNYG